MNSYLLFCIMSEDACDCGQGMLACNDGETCVDAVKVCDGRRDCPNNDDEKSCSKLLSWVLYLAPFSVLSSYHVITVHIVLVTDNCPTSVTGRG